VTPPADSGQDGQLPPDAPPREVGVDDPAGPYAGRMFRLAGLVLLLFVGFRLLLLATLDADLTAFDRVRDLAGSAGGRLVASVALLALLYHALDGIRITFVESWARLARADRWLRPLTVFLTVALWIPGAVLVFRPLIEDRL
jgi:succinate dehydrogenase/fumarate reductase cytochrome b subunit